MTNQLKVKPVDLAKVWSLTKSAEQRQFTLRVPSETFIRIQALEAMFPGRSRNEMVSDLLATAIDEFVDGLPVEQQQIEDTSHCVAHDPDGEPVFASYIRLTGPRADFLELVEDARRNLSKGSELKVVDGTEEAA